MAYSSTGNPLRKLLDFGITSAGSLWAYESTHPHATIEATAGFFTGTGAGSPSSGCLGVRVGDLLVNINKSTAGTSAITWHRVDSLTTSSSWGAPITPIVSVASS